MSPTCRLSSWLVRGVEMTLTAAGIAALVMVMGFWLGPPAFNFPRRPAVRKVVFDTTTPSTTPESPMRETILNEDPEILTLAAMQIGNTDLRNSLAVLSIPERASRFGQNLFERWSRLEPEAALRSAELLPPGTLRSTSREQAAIEWMKRDSSATIAWLAAVSDKNEQRQLRFAVASSLVDREPLGAMRLALELPPGESRTAVVLQALPHLAALDLQGARQWVDGLPVGEVRDLSVAAIAPEWAKQDALAAIVYVHAEIAGVELQNRAMVAILKRWGQTDPVNAADWALHFMDGPVRDFSLGMIVEDWARCDALKSAQWLSSLPVGSYRDRGVFALVKVLRETEPVVAAKWAATLSDPDLQRELLRD